MTESHDPVFRREQKQPHENRVTRDKSSLMKVGSSVIYLAFEESRTAAARARRSGLRCSGLASQQRLV